MVTARRAPREAARQSKVVPSSSSRTRAAHPRDGAVLLRRTPSTPTLVATDRRARHQERTHSCRWRRGRRLRRPPQTSRADGMRELVQPAPRGRAPRRQLEGAGRARAAAERRVRTRTRARERRPRVAHEPRPENHTPTRSRSITAQQRGPGAAARADPARRAPKRSLSAPASDACGIQAGASDAGARAHADMCGARRARGSRT